MQGNNLRIDGDRLWASIMETARFGATPKGGLRRLTLSEEDREVRQWLLAAAKEAGLTAHVDDLGDMFLIRPGRDASRPPVAFGSHLDTQPAGGKFDGVLGVLAGLEVMRALNDAGIETDAPLCLVNWTNEEGARFAPAMLASGVYGGELDKDFALSRTDSDGKRFGDALEEIGFSGEEPVGERRLGAFVELHIEQGPILEAERKTIGVVTHAQGMMWYNVTAVGRDSHAGSTPMHLRKDALAGMSEIALAVERIARGHQPGVGTIGEVHVSPNSRNTVPGEVRFTSEFRHPERAALDAMHGELEAAVRQVAGERGLTIDLDRIWIKDPVVFDAKVVSAVESATESLGYPARHITSGAGHDACNVASVAPTAMIFVPCKDGISHNELEDATKDDCVAGANVLLHAVLRLAQA